MPTSSTNRRLTYEFYKPPPKSLQEIRLEQKNDYRDSDRSGSHSSFLKREKYRNSFSEKQVSKHKCNRKLRVLLALLKSLMLKVFQQ